MTVKRQVVNSLTQPEQRDQETPYRLPARHTKSIRNQEFESLQAESNNIDKGT
jgi:hypothetical protein